MSFTCSICGETHTFSREHFYVISQPIVVCNRCAEMIWESYKEVIRSDQEAKEKLRQMVEEHLEEVTLDAPEKIFVRKVLAAFCTEDMDDLHSQEIRGVIDSLFWAERVNVPMIQQWISNGNFSEEERFYFSKWLENKDETIEQIMEMIDGFNIAEGMEYEDGEFDDEDVNSLPKSSRVEQNEAVSERHINITEIISEVLKAIKCQDYGVIQIGRLIYRHLLRVSYNATHPEDKIYDKQNFIVVGPTGVGKTATIREYSRLLGLPCVEIDMTGITKAGYVGENITDSFAQLVSMANGNIALAQRGIVILDEGDKNSGESDGLTRDPGGKAVMIEMLKKLEGTDVDIGNGRFLNTTDILFICLGTFEGAYEQRNMRLGGKKRLGFGEGESSKKPEQIQRFTPEDLIKGGAPAEWVGRFSCIIEFKKLLLDDYVTIMRESSKSIFLQTQKLLAYGFGGVELIMTSEGERRIAELAEKYDVGVRGLNRIITEFLEEVEGNLVMLKGPYSKITIGETVTYE